MATSPVFPVTPKIGYGTLTTANTAHDGTGTMTTVFTAGANGSVVDKIAITSLGTNVATVLRLFINNGSDSTVAANNSLVFEKTIDATALSEVAELTTYELLTDKGSNQFPPIPFLPAGYKINCTIGTTVAGGIQVTVFGGDY